jgi:predicted ferric reductase
MMIMATATAESPLVIAGDARDLGRRARMDAAVRLGTGLLLWAGLLLITYWWDADGGINDLGRPATGLLSIGRLTGLWSAHLLLVQVLLISRLPALENAFGRNRLVAIHRIVGLTSFYLMVAHIVTIVGGYASARWSLVLPTTWQLITEYGGMLLATAGTIALIMVVVTSIKAARRRLRYESWHLIHLYGYLGAGLALPHQLWTGQEFLRSRGATLYWWSLWGAAGLAVIIWRLVLPVWRSVRFELRVAAVITESADTVSVILSGRRLDRLPVQPGQFLIVRFLSGVGWTRANPFSVSAAPDGRTLRITARAVGDGSARLARLRPGIRVAFEGPYGRLSPRARTVRPVLLAGAGIGVTPLRALAEGMEYAPGEATLLYRYTGEPLFGAEFDRLAGARGLKILALPGARSGTGGVLGPVAAGHDELQVLRHWLPDLADSDVYICGPQAWASGFERLVAAAGVPGERIHTETFGW